MSSIVSIATPHLPTSPALKGSSESRPISVGRSNAVDNPVLAFVEVLAWLSRYLNRLFVSSALPKPANCRIVHRRDRYPCGNSPRVYGYFPGAGRFVGMSRSDSVGDSGPYEGSSTSPEIVTA